MKLTKEFLETSGLFSSDIEQILENQEKAEKWDIDGTVHLHLIKELEQENKQLKEDYEKLDKLHEKMTLKKHEYHQLNLNLKAQVARELKDNNGLRVTIGKYFNLKQKLEKIKEWWNDEDATPKQMNKLLDSQEKE